MKELVEYVARSLVDNKDAVTVEETVGPEATILELHVAPEDMGKVIGKQGRIAKAIRSVVRAATAKDWQIVGDKLYDVTDGYQLILDGAAPTVGDKAYWGAGHAAELAENQFFIADLLGAEAVDTKGGEIGVLKDVLTPGGTDIFVFDTPAGEVMVPIIEKVVVSLDVEAGRIVLNEETLNEVAVYEDRHSDHLSRNV